MSRTLNSLQELGTAFVPSPNLPKLELGDLADLEAQGKIIREAAAQTRTWVRSTLAQLEAVRGAKREVQELVALKVAKAQKDLDNLFLHEVPAYRRATWLGLLEHELSKGLHTRQEVENLLERLVKEGRLVECADGTLKAYRRTYAVSPDAAFGKPETTRVGELLSTLLNQVFQETGMAREKKDQELRAQGSFDLEALQTGTPGKYVVEVPPEKVVRDSDIFWRGGGVLLVESNGQDIWPLGVSGAIEAAIQEAQTLGVSLKAYTLAWDNPPVVPGLDLGRGKKVQLLWYLLKRGIRVKEEAERLSQTRETLTGQATVTAEEFFLERKLGICLAEFQETWQNLDGSAGPSHFLFLVERKEEGEIRKIRIKDAPDLSDFFAQCMDEYEEGEKFEGCPQPLRAVLRAIYGQVLKASRDAEKASQIANG